MSRLLVRFVVVAAVLATVSVAFVACGGSDSDTTSSDTGASDTTSGGEASGEPIKLMSMTVVSPELDASEIQESAETRAEMINEEGGINGRPVEIKVCNTKLDPNVTVQCARQAASEGVASVVGGLSFFPQIYPILEQAKIPFIGGLGISPEELNAPISYPVGGGEPAWFFGEAKLLKEKGVKKPVVVTCEPESCLWAVEVFEEGWEALGGGDVQKVLVPDGVTDMTAVAASATSSGADGIALATYDSVNSQLIKAIRQTGFEGPIIINATNISTETIKSLGPFSKELYVSGLELPATSEQPEAIAYREAMDKFAPGAKLTELGTNAFAATDLFIKIAEKVDGDITGASVKDALDNETGTLEPALAPPWTTPNNPVNPNYSRLQKIEAAISAAQPNGTLEQEKPGFINVAE